MNKNQSNQLNLKNISILTKSNALRLIAFHTTTFGEREKTACELARFGKVSAKPNLSRTVRAARN
jgi:hypothetical protein